MWSLDFLPLDNFDKYLLRFLRVYPIGSMGLVYLPTSLPSKSTIHSGKSTVRPMGPSWDVMKRQCQCSGHSSMFEKGHFVGASRLVGSL